MLGEGCEALISLTGNDDIRNVSNALMVIQRLHYVSQVFLKLGKLPHYIAVKCMCHKAKVT